MNRRSWRERLPRARRQRRLPVRQRCRLKPADHVGDDRGLSQVLIECIRGQVGASITLMRREEAVDAVEVGVISAIEGPSLTNSRCCRDCAGKKDARALLSGVARAWACWFRNCVTLRPGVKRIFACDEISASLSSAIRRSRISWAP